MTDEPTITAHFNIAGNDLDFDEISSQIGVIPTRTWRQKDEDIAKSHPEIENSNWSWGFENRVFSSTDDALVDLLGGIWPQKERIQEYVRSNPSLVISTTLNVTFQKSRPLYEFGPETMSRLAELNCSLLLDIFDYS